MKDLTKKLMFITSMFSMSLVFGETLNEYQNRQEQMSANEILDFLKNGNKRFSKGRAIQGAFLRDARVRVQNSAEGQKPLAAVLSCIDSRTAPEIVFDTNVGDLFTTRVGGNVISDDVIGSLEVSVASGVKVVVILGHSDCGAVKGACRDVEFEHLTGIIEKVKPSIARGNEKLDLDPELSQKIGERSPENSLYISHISHMNAKNSLEQLLEKSSFLRQKHQSGEIIILSALYDVRSGEVNFHMD